MCGGGISLGCVCVFCFNVPIASPPAAAESDDALLESPQPAAVCAASDTRVDLQGSDLWKRFHEIGTEMIITKAGR